MSRTKNVSRCSNDRQALYIVGVTRLFALLSVLVAAAVFSATAVAHKRPLMQRMTLFGDSVASALDWVPTAKRLRWVHSSAAAVEGLLPLRELAAHGVIKIPALPRTNQKTRTGQPGTLMFDPEKVGHPPVRI